MPTALDLVHNTMAKTPGEFQTNFSGLVTDKIAELIAGKRIELAQSIFGGVPPNEPDDEVDPPETPDENDDEFDGAEDDVEVKDNEDGEDA